MGKKVTSIRAKSIKKAANENYEKFLKEGYSTNPIAAKLFAFQKTKKDNSKDLL